MIRLFLLEQSDLGLCCLPKPYSLKTKRFDGHSHVDAEKVQGLFRHFRKVFENVNGKIQKSAKLIEEKYLHVLWPIEKI